MPPSRDGHQHPRDGDAITRVLVTGGAGFIGSHLCWHFLDRGCEVYAVDNFRTGSRSNIERSAENHHFRFFEMDVTDPLFRETFLRIPVQQIYHLACPTGVPNIRTLAWDMLRTCSIGTFNVLDIARAHRSSILLTSSCEVYGQPERFPQDEFYNGNVSPLGPRSAYEEGKRFAESIIGTAAQCDGVDGKIVRIFNTYGPGMSVHDQRVIPQFLGCILRGDPLSIFGDGRQTRTFLYIDDLLRGLLAVMERGKTGRAYNVGSEEEIAVRDLAAKARSLVPDSSGIVFLPHFTEDHHRRRPDTRSLRALGWEPRISLEEGLRKTFDFFRESTSFGVTMREAARTVAP